MGDDEDDPLARRLAEAADRVRRHAKLTRALVALRAGVDKAGAERRDAERVVDREARDVERWERRGVRALFGFLAGNLDERRRRERAELRRAQAVLAERTARLGALRIEEQRLRAELAPLGSSGSVKRAYQRAFAAREAALAASGPLAPAMAAASAEHAERIADLREIDEAISAGNAARDALDAVLEALGRARSLGGWDMLGGGLFVTWMKHRRIDDVGILAQEFSARAHRFQRELKDVNASIAPVGTVEMSELLRGTDLLFDNIITDILVQRRINRADDHARAAWRDLHRALEALAERRRAAAAAVETAARTRRELVEGDGAPQH